METYAAIGAAQANAYAKNADAIKTPEFQVAMKRLASTNARLNELCQMSGGIADKVVGFMPETQPAGCTPGVEKPAECFLSELLYAIEQANRSVERVYSNVSRIGREF